MSWKYMKRNVRKRTVLWSVDICVESQKKVVKFGCEFCITCEHCSGTMHLAHVGSFGTLWYVLAHFGMLWHTLACTGCFGMHWAKQSRTKLYRALQSSAEACWATALPQLCTALFCSAPVTMRPKIMTCSPKQPKAAQCTPCSPNRPMHPVQSKAAQVPQSSPCSTKCAKAYESVPMQPKAFRAAVRPSGHAVKRAPWSSRWFEDFGCSDFSCSDFSHFYFLKILIILLNIHNLGTHLAYKPMEWNWQNRTFGHCFTSIATYEPKELPISIFKFSIKNDFPPTFDPTWKVFKVFQK